MRASHLRAVLSWIVFLIVSSFSFAALAQTTPPQAFVSKFTVQIAHMLASENIDVINVNRMTFYVGLSLKTGDRFYVLSNLRADGRGRAVRRYYYFLEPDLLMRPLEQVARMMVPQHLRSGNLMREDGRAMWGNLRIDGAETLGTSFLLSDGRILDSTFIPRADARRVQSDFGEYRLAENKRPAFKTFFDFAAKPEHQPSMAIGEILSEVSRVKRFFESAEHRRQDQIRRELTEIQKNPPKENRTNVVDISRGKVEKPVLAPVQPENITPPAEDVKYLLLPRADNRDYTAVGLTSGEVKVFLRGGELARTLPSMGHDIQKISFTPNALVIEYRDRVVVYDSRTLKYGFSHLRYDPKAEAARPAVRTCEGLFLPPI